MESQGLLLILEHLQGDPCARQKLLGIKGSAGVVVEQLLLHTLLDPLDGSPGGGRRPRAWLDVH